MNHLDICLSSLRSLEEMSFRFRPKTEEPFVKAVSLAKAFQKLSSEDRSRVVDSLSPNGAMKLLSLSGFLAEAAINKKEGSLLEAAVCLHVIEDFRKDYRENIRYLVLLAYAAKEIGVDVSLVISSMLTFSSDRAAKCLSDFLSRSEDLNNLVHFGIRGELADGAFRFSPA